MPRASRRKSHRERKHSSKEARDYSDSEEFVKIRERNSKEDVTAKNSRDSVSGEKRKLVSQSRELSGYGNGKAGEEYVLLKRSKENAEGSGDSWKGGRGERGDGGVIDKDPKGATLGLDSDKGQKLKELKVTSDLKSKGSRRHKGGSEKREVNASPVVEKEESKSGSGVDLKRKSNKDSVLKEACKDNKELTDNGGWERKVHDGNHGAEMQVADGEVERKQVSESVHTGEDRQSKRGRENNGLIQDDSGNHELEKGLEKRKHRRRDDSGDKDKLQNDTKERERQKSSRSDQLKDRKYKDARHKDGNGVKYREDGDKASRHKDEKYRKASEKDDRHGSSKYHEDADKYHKDGERDTKRRGDRYHEDGDREKRRSSNRHRENGEKDDWHRDVKHRVDGDRDNRQREDRHRTDVDKCNRHKDATDDVDKEKNHRDVRYGEECSSRVQTKDKSNIKCVRDEINVAANINDMDISNCDASPSYDEHASRYKEDDEKIVIVDKEDHGDIRSRCSREQNADAGKRSMSSAKIGIVTDRKRSASRYFDAEHAPSHSSRRVSPSSCSYAARDHYRLSKQEEPKYRDYIYEERVPHDIFSSRECAGTVEISDKISSSQSLEKTILRNDRYFELTAERHLKTGSHVLPLLRVDGSPPSTSTDRRHLNRSEVRQSLDVEDSRQRNGGSRDAKDHSGKECRGSRELTTETLPIDELSQADEDNLSVSSPFQISRNSRSHLPPLTFRTGMDSPVVAGSLEDDRRCRLNNRHRRTGDPNTGRVHGSTWKSVPRWPSPLANGFMTLQHGPPPVNFHPMMPQFAAPPLFGVRPPMELNQTGIRYHLPDAGRFSGHVRPLGWRNPVDESCPPPLHGWDPNNAVFVNESHVCQRVAWDHNRTLASSQGWDTGGDTCIGQKTGMNLDLPSTLYKEHYSAHGSDDEAWTGQSGQQALSEQRQSELQIENISQSSDAFARNTSEAAKTIFEGTSNLSKMSEEEDASLCHVYLSRLDVSADLALPRLYDQCISLIDVDQNRASDDSDFKILYVEEVVEAKMAIPHKISSSSLFPHVNDTVFQKAMYLYKKQREEFKGIGRDKVPFLGVESLEFLSTFSQEKACSNNGKAEEQILAFDLQEAEGAVSNCDQGKDEQLVNFQIVEEFQASSNQKLDDSFVGVSLEKKQEEPMSTLDMVKMEVVQVSNQERVEHIIEEKSISGKIAERAGAYSPQMVEDASGSSVSRVNYSGSSEEGQKLVDTKNESNPMLFSDVPSEACEAVMPGSFESGSVNLSRIHHSPESTH